MTAVSSTCQCHSKENIAAKPEGLRGLDLLGVVLSSACLIHCTLLPAVLALLPLLGNQFHLDERWHFYITALIVPVACIALVTGWLRHRKNLVIALGIISLTMILGAHPLHGRVRGI